MSVRSRLAVYGTLAPGESNNHVLEDHMTGEWFQGWVHGQVGAHGWGQYEGYPGIILDADLPEVAVQVFESAQLADHWDRLDQFEGEGYRRIKIEVRIDSDESVEAFIYESLPPP